MLNRSQTLTFKYALRIEMPIEESNIPADTQERKYPFDSSGHLLTRSESTTFIRPTITQTKHESH